MKPDIEQKLEQLADAIPDNDSFVNDVMSRIENCPVQLGMKQNRNHVTRRIQMKTISKYAAAVIVISGVSMLFLFNSGHGSVALADVYARVQQAQAFMYQMSATMAASMTEGAPPQNMEMETVVLVSNDYGVKMENTMHLLDQDKTAIQQIYIIPDEKKMIQIVPDEKTYSTMELSDAQLEEMKQKNNDPREVIRQMLNGQYTDLGFSKIDGRKVQGFQSTTGDDAGNLTTTIWVDVETWLPVRVEVSLTMEKKMETDCVIDQFQWDVPVTAADFEYVITDDYIEQINIQ